MKNPSPLTQGIEPGTYFYFVHSYCASTQPQYVLLETRYGQEIPALVTDGKWVFGAQFHPEKSSGAGATAAAEFLGGLLKGLLQHNW